MQMSLELSKKIAPLSDCVESFLLPADLMRGNGRDFTAHRFLPAVGSKLFSV